ncbi:type II toxin-antitoxin system BrnA family antitoxin [Thermodesulfobacteriota bacterium]
MAQNKYAKNAKEFDKRFDSGEDITGLVDLKTAKISRPGKKVRITLDMAEDLVNEIDRIKEKIGVDRGALIKVWIHERVQQEKSGEKHFTDYKGR